MSATKEILSAGEIDTLISDMASQIKKDVLDKTTQKPLMIGIHSGGVWIAEKLHKKLKLDAPLGKLDISFYRDDFSQIGLHPQITPSKLPFDIENNPIILIDDVLYTGRTIRAAMNEVFDYGRPAQIYLAVLISRNSHELPIQADAIGKTILLDNNQQVKLSNTTSLSLELITTDD